MEPVCVRLALHSRLSSCCGTDAPPSTEGLIYNHVGHQTQSTFSNQYVPQQAPTCRIIRVSAVHTRHFRQHFSCRRLESHRQLSPLQGHLGKSIPLDSAHTFCISHDTNSTSEWRRMSPEHYMAALCCTAECHMRTTAMEPVRQRVKTNHLR